MKCCNTNSAMNEESYWYPWPLGVPIGSPALLNEAVLSRPFLGSVSLFLSVSADNTGVCESLSIRFHLISPGNAGDSAPRQHREREPCLSPPYTETGYLTRY